jgi:bacterial/archaeal transporter family protein
MGILLAFLSALLLGVANLLLKKGYKDFSPSVAFFIFSVFSLVGWGILGLILGVDFTNPLYGLMIGTVSAILGQALYIYVLSKGELSITATIIASYSIYTILLSIIFNNESLSQGALIMIGLAILGTLIVSAPEKGSFSKSDFKRIKLILLAVIVAIGIGASDVLAKYYINNSSDGSFLFYTSIAQVFVSLVYLKMDKEPLDQFRGILSKLKEYQYPLLGSLFVSISTMCFFTAFNHAQASVVSPINSSSPVITVLLSVFFLKEKLTKKNALGILLVLIAIVGVSFIGG